MANETVFSDMFNETNCLQELLPAKQDSDVAGELRDAKQDPVSWARTERFKKSTIVYALSIVVLFSCQYIYIYIYIRAPIFSSD